MCCLATVFILDKFASVIYVINNSVLVLWKQRSDLEYLLTSV